MKRRKTTLNVPLKVACVQTKQTQGRLALQMRLGESRLSQIINGTGSPVTEPEQRSIVKVLNQYPGVDVAVETLWPPKPAAMAS